MIQEDLVGLCILSRAMGSRVLDRLQANRVVVTERYGMTDRVRLIGDTTGCPELGKPK